MKSKKHRNLTDQILNFRRVAAKYLSIDEDDFYKIPKSRLKELRGMSDEVQRLDELVEREEADEIEYKAPCGSILANGLFKDEGVAVCRVLMTAGSKFERHHHEAHEYGIVYEGAAEFEINGTSKRVYVGDYVYFPPGVPHNIKEIIEDCRMVFISVPPAKGYPDAG